VLQDVYKSESDTNQRNQAIGALMLAYGYIKDNWQQAVTSTPGSARSASTRRTLRRWRHARHGGKNPVTGKVVMDAAKVPGVLAVMATAGLYDDSGKWLYHTGLPARAASAAASSPSRPASSASPSSLRRSTMRQQREGAEGDRRHLERAGRESARSIALKCLSQRQRDPRRGR
jgi:hypothetical protein